jgi:hypothetical protein
MTASSSVSLTAAVATAAVLRPLEVLLQSAYIIAGRSTPATLRGTNPATTLVMALTWFIASAWSDGYIRPGVFNWFGAAFEIAAWTFALRYGLRRYGDPRRTWPSWLAVAGISTLAWLLSGIGFAAGLPPMAVSLVVFALAIRGFGRVLYTAFSGRLGAPYGTAGAWLLLVGMSGLAAHHALQVVGLIF